jgi:hypothetical protein
MDHTLTLVRIDTSGALERDVKPFFPAPTHMLPRCTDLPTPDPLGLRQSISFDSWLDRYPSHASVVNILEDLTSFEAYMVHSNISMSQTSRSGYDVSSKWVLPMLHRCLVLTPATSRIVGVDSGSVIHECLRHTTILSLLSIRRSLGIAAIGQPSRVSWIRAAIEHTELDDWRICDDLFLWVLLVAGTESLLIGEDTNSGLTVWYAEQVVRWQKRVLIHTRYAEDIRTYLNGIQWPGSMHWHQIQELLQHSQLKWRCTQLD